MVQGAVGRLIRHPVECSLPILQGERPQHSNVFTSGSWSPPSLHVTPKTRARSCELCARPPKRTGGLILLYQTSTLSADATEAAEVAFEEYRDRHCPDRRAARARAKAPAKADRARLPKKARTRHIPVAEKHAVIARCRDRCGVEGCEEAE